MRLPRIGLGCMSLSHAYGVPPSADDGLRMLHAAIDAGVRLLDTATLYGAGRNEELVGRAIRGRRDEIVLASKGGLVPVAGVKTIDGRPETLRAHVDASLGRLDVEHIDLYYLHRWDKAVPIGESIGALAEKDIRHRMPRFQPEHWRANAALLPEWRALAVEAGCAPAQLALAWVLSRGDHVVAIPGTTSAAHAREDLAAGDLVVDPELLERADELINASTVSGPRYSEASSREVDAESFEAAA